MLNITFEPEYTLMTPSPPSVALLRESHDTNVRDRPLSHLWERGFEHAIFKCACKKRNGYTLIGH